jgi:hypothetical protein
MKRLFAVVAVFFMVIFQAAIAGAEPVLLPIDTPPVKPVSPLLITAYEASADGLDLVQIYNNSDELVSLDGMVLKYSQETSDTVSEIPLSGMMKPASHVLIAARDVLETSDRVAFRFMPVEGMPGTFWIESPSYLPVTLPDKAVMDGFYKRKYTPSGTSYTTATTFTSAFGLETTSPVVVEADALYDIPPSPAVEIVEVSARSKTCSPFDVDATCSDYIKLRILQGFDMSTLGDYRVRTGGEESVTNTFSLANASKQGDYLLLRLRDDGAFITLASSGGYVWMEDVFGLTHYEPTLVEYANASSEAYVNQSWALDDSDGTWKWAIPSPTGPNTFPKVLAEATEAPTECPAGKYRSPETNRCRTVEEAVNELAQCEEGKERNPLTNRCRSVATATSATLTPCDAGEERNPATNRCHKVVAATAELVPCQMGYERNLATNRCRKVLTSGSPATTPAAIKQSGSSFLSSTLLATAGVGVVGYGVYEWRHEIWSGLQKAVRIISRK